jgi:hypothetical protein
MKAAISIPDGKIQKHVYLIRKREVVLDLDLAVLYGIPVVNIKSVVKRNMKSFPPEIMFSLNSAELDQLSRRISTSTHGGMRYAPMAFTAEGVNMLSSILNSERNQTV